MTPPNSSPKGSLEELFRHHLLESEAAAVPPFPHVWEQLDNSLLQAQNERYRRRLAAYRWAMAASLLLAVLAGGGWWRSQSRQPGSLAAEQGTAAHSPAGTGYHIVGLSQAYASSLFSSPRFLSSIEQTPTISLSLANGIPFAAPLGPGTHHLWTADDRANATRYITSASPAYAQAARVGSQPAPAAAWLLAANAYAAPTPGLTATDADLLAADQLRGRLANLRLPALAAPPAQLAGAGPTAWVPAPALTRPWQLEVAYATSVFDPNIDFRKANTEYNADLGPSTIATTREAAAEYRQHLRAGLGQRLSVWATRRLGIGRWSLRTGLEVSQNTARSASSVGFVGEQVATLNNYVQVQSNRLQGTTYRYRSVGVPVEVTYTNPMRRGFSLYGRAGALVSSLLNIHSEVDGNPEATRSYSTQSSSSPYRHVAASVRGGLGVRYEPAGRQWALNVGPVAEAGIMSLNIDPTQDFWNQQRPYSFGLEASVQFTSLLKPTAPVLVP